MGAGAGGESVLARWGFDFVVLLGGDRSDEFGRVEVDMMELVKQMGKCISRRNTSNGFKGEGKPT